MDNSSNEYHISFFKPTTAHATANRNMVIWLVLVWFIAIFGFQILLKVFEKPTPEPEYLIFQNVWGNVLNGSQKPEDLQQFGHATLSVLGKISVSPEERIALDNALSWSVYQLTTNSEKEDLITKIRAFEKLKAEIENISDPKYVLEKINISNQIGSVLSLSSHDVRSKILPLELTSDQIKDISDETKSSLPGIMEKYLVHNQSFLTDFKFLGFPFHYFYTAIFLLVLFVGLCWLYCVRTDKINAQLNIID